MRNGLWLLRDRFSAVDVLCSSPFEWFTEMTRNEPVIRDCVKRCGEWISSA